MQWTSARLVHKSEASEKSIFLLNDDVSNCDARSSPELRVCSPVTSSNDQTGVLACLRKEKYGKVNEFHTRPIHEVAGL